MDDVNSFRRSGFKKPIFDAWRFVCSHLKFILCLLANAFVVGVVNAQAVDALSAQISIARWEKAVVFRWKFDKCTQTDIPDEPPRAFRDYRGTVHLFATHEDNRILIGKDFYHLLHPCKIAFIGHHSSIFSDFSDRVWLTSFYTEDGRHITALAHDEFQGNLRNDLCPSGSYMSCWENAITMVTSDDGGATFVEPKAPKNVVASIPYPYQGEVGRPIGYFQPSNIVSITGAHYVMIHAEAFSAQQYGVCVAKSTSIRDPSAWRAWDGHGYHIAFVDPYVSQINDESAHVCAPVGKGSLFDFGSLTLDPVAGIFYAITAIAHGTGNSSTPPGAYVSTSRDLIQWSAPKLLVSEAELKSRDPEISNNYGFFSMIDEGSNSADFSTISARPKLFLYYVEMNQRNPPYDRNLVKLPLQLARHVGSRQD
jgi:hypothetical protein